MNTMQLACFTEVAASLSFSRAANNLQVSQPTVSHQIKSLEDELGCELLARSTRSVALTDEGYAFLGYAHDILGLAIRAKQHLQGSEARSAQTVRIGVSDGAEARFLAPVLAMLYRADADFDPAIRMGPHSALVDMLENGRLDVVLEYRDPTGAPAGATVLRRLCDAAPVLVCAPDHPLASCQVVASLDDLDGSQRIAVGNPHTLPAAVTSLQRLLTMRVDPMHVMMCPNIEVVLALVASGIAYTILPDNPAWRRDGLRTVPVAGLPPVVFGVRLRRGRRARQLDAFVNALSAYLQEEGTADACPEVSRYNT